MSSAESVPPPRRRLGRLLRLAAQALVLVAAAYFLWRVIHSIGWVELWDQIAASDGRWTAIAVVLLVVRFIVWDFRWRLAFRRLGPPPGALRTFFSLLAAACANTLTPAARVVGGFLRARHVASSTHTFGRVFGVVFFDQMVHQLVMALAGWVAFVGMAFLLGHRALGIAAAVALVVAAGVFAHWTTRLDEARVESMAEWAARRSGVSGGPLSNVYLHGSEAVRVVRRLLDDAALRRAALLLTVIYVVLNGLAQWALFRAIAYPVDLLTVLLGVAAGTAAGAFTGTPGGAGTTEAGMILAYAVLEVPKMEASAATIFYRALHYLVILALGLPALAFFEAQVRRRQPGTDEVLP